MGQLILKQLKEQAPVEAREVGYYPNELGVVNHSDPAVGFISYAEFVATLAKDMNDPVLDRLHQAVGISGEAGELLDSIKKNWVYGKELDRKNILEELGDIFFYAQAMMILMNFSLQDVLTANKDKLEIRYKNLVYSDQAAQNRADKKETGETESSGSYIHENPTPGEPKVNAINLPKAAIDGMDETAGIYKEFAQAAKSKDEEPAAIIAASTPPAPPSD